MTSLLDYLKAKGIDPTQLSSQASTPAPTDDVPALQALAAAQTPTPPPSPTPEPGPMAPLGVQLPVSPAATGPANTDIAPAPTDQGNTFAGFPTSYDTKNDVSRDPADEDEEDDKGSISGKIHIKGSNAPDRQKQAIQDAINHGGFTNNTVDGLKAAQDKAKADTALDSIFRGVGNITGGLVGMGKNTKSPDQTENNKFYDLQDKAAAQGVTDFTARGEQEKNDPKSALSVGARQFAAPLLQKLGITLPENVSYAGMEKLNPQLTKLYDSQETRNAHSDDLKYKYDMLAEMKRQANSTKNEGLSDKLGKQLETALDPDQARAGNFAKSKAVLNAADRVNALFDQFPDYNIPKAQTVELATATAAMISGGTPQSQHQIEQLVPESAIGQGADGIAKWLSNAPQGRHQQEFMKMMHDTAKREGDVAKNQIMTTQVQRLAAHEKLKQIDPDNYNRILQARGLDPDVIQDFIKNKGRLSPKAPAAPGLTTPSDGSSPATPGKVRVSNGTETLEIDPSDLDHATADGYKQVK